MNKKEMNRFLYIDAYLYRATRRNFFNEMCPDSSSSNNLNALSISSRESR